MEPLIRVIDAGLGIDAQVRLVVSHVDSLDVLKSRWATSGATLERKGDRLIATSTVEALARAAGRAFGAERGREIDAVLHRVVAAWRGPSPAWVLPSGPLRCDLRPVIMGIVNVTPDSFSDGGALYPDGHPERAIAHAQTMIGDGADVLDVGGESTRPGAAAVKESEELSRVEPVLAGLEGAAVLSIDTTKPKVALAAVARGAQIINDTSGAADPELLAVAAEHGCGYVLMHTRGTPKVMAQQTEYDDVVAQVYEWLADGLARCAAAGIAAERIAIDPGLGFAKTPAHNFAILDALRQFRGLGHPLVIGASRKSFLGVATDGAAADDRLEASLACVALAVAARAAVVRVHDVAASLRVARVVHAVNQSVDNGVAQAGDGDLSAGAGGHAWPSARD